MKFNDMQYTRPDMTAVRTELEALTAAASAAGSAADLEKVIMDYEESENRIATAMELCEIRHTVDTTDAFYAAEADFMDENTPLIGLMQMQFSKAVLSNPYAGALADRIGGHFLTVLQANVDAMNPDLVADMQEENKLTTAYQKLMASAQLPFRGETLNLSGLNKYMESADRTTRAEAYRLFAGFIAEHEAELDDIYDKLVKLRTAMGKKMGYDNYLPLGYKRMQRFGYGPEEVATFRAQVKRYIVPAATKLLEQQRERIGVDQLTYYDEKLCFPEGNPTPCGTYEEQVASAQRMYNELSPETGEFFSFMVDSGLMDLKSKPGKANGGYCTFIPAQKAPFIFSNFNGTSADVDVLTHEAGHAFQCYLSARLQKLWEYVWPTTEACEIHSMSMEFLTYPWMESFFGEAADKYRSSHLAAAVTFIPYGTLVDDFQHHVYENPDWSPAERKACWRQLEHEYLPLRTYDGEACLEGGALFYRQLHIMMNPLYYIDYCFAQLSALEFYTRSLTDREGAWQQYLKLCRLGGSKPYPELLKAVSLASPFEEGSIDKIIASVMEVLKC